MWIVVGYWDKNTCRAIGPFQSREQARDWTFRHGGEFAWTEFLVLTLPVS